MLNDKCDENKDIDIDLPTGIPPLTSLYFYLTDSCNLACKHCWISPAYKENKQAENGKCLDFDHLYSAVQQAKPLGLKSVKLTGGEPLLHPEFKNIVNLIRNESLSVLLETNGILIEEEMAAFLGEAETKPFISISLDGSQAENHEELRGVTGCFSKSINAVKALVKNGIHPQIICTLHQKNLIQIKDLVKMSEDMGCESVKFNLIQEIGRGLIFNKKSGLSIKKIIDLNNYIEKDIIPAHNIRVIYDIPVAFYPIKRLLRNNPRKCGIFNILGILFSGQVSLCGIGVSVPELIFGHLKDQKLRDIWCDSRALNDLREKIPLTFDGICNKCIHRDVCLGSCIANNYFRSGRINASYALCEEADKLGIFPLERRIKQNS